MLFVFCNSGVGGIGSVLDLQNTYYTPSHCQMVNLKGVPVLNKWKQDSLYLPSADSQHKSQITVGQQHFYMDIKK